jgi:hypothetical protein
MKNQNRQKHLYFFLETSAFVQVSPLSLAAMGIASGEQNYTSNLRCARDLSGEGIWYWILDTLQASSHEGLCPSSWFRPAKSSSVGRRMRLPVEMLRGLSRW